MKKLTIELTERQVEMAKKFATNQYPGAEANVGTRFPTIHVVESRGWSTPLAEGFGGTEQWYFDGHTFFSFEDLKQFIYEEYCQSEEDIKENGYDSDCVKYEDVDVSSDLDTLNDVMEDYIDQPIELFECEEVWKPVAMFFIREEAVAYQKYQAHNLGESRVYTYSTGYGNNGTMKDLGELLLAMGNQLVKEDESNADK